MFYDIADSKAPKWTPSEQAAHRQLMELEQNWLSGSCLPTSDWTFPVVSVPLFQVSEHWTPKTQCPQTLHWSLQRNSIYRSSLSEFLCGNRDFQLRFPLPGLALPICCRHHSVSSLYARLKCPCRSAGAGKDTAMATGPDSPGQGLCSENSDMSGTEIKILCCSTVCCIKARKGQQ